ncbi:MAG: VanW family protein [Candidatus Obscuribacterales bacterium]|nr:VanW family protein [Candidatus Obscuribacterales bacterium]
MILIPLATVAVIALTFPFSDVLAGKNCSLTDLSKIQRSNIRIAARSLNGLVIKAGEEFSFNRTVGPRTDGRGYRAAPSYLETGSPSTVGGGICLLSSLLYQSALESGCAVTERTAHTRTIKSVPPGLDSTVWYGQVDLKFRNPYPAPIQIATEWTPTQLKLKILGRKSDKVQIGALQTLVSNRNKDEIVVEVVRKGPGTPQFVSRDHYMLAH